MARTEQEKWRDDRLLAEAGQIYDLLRDGWRPPHSHIVGVASPKNRGRARRVSPYLDSSQDIIALSLLPVCSTS